MGRKRQRQQESLRACTGAYRKALLVLATRACFRLSRLSAKVVRSICGYIACVPLVPMFFSDLFCVFDMRTKRGTVVTLSENMFLRAPLCCVSEVHTILFPAEDAARAVKSVSLLTFQLRDEMPTLESCDSPGIGRYGRFLWLFGGRYGGSKLQSSAKFDLARRVWKALPPLPFAAADFTPCELNGEFFLPTLLGREQPLQVFSTLTNSYRITDWEVPVLGSCPVFLAESGLLTIISKGKQWVQAAADTGSVVARLRHAARYQSVSALPVRQDAGVVMVLDHRVLRWRNDTVSAWFVTLCLGERTSSAEESAYCEPQWEQSRERPVSVERNC